MAKKAPIQRSYRMGDATLVQTADEYVSLVTRDMADLAAYGITAATVADLEVKRAAVADHPSDEALLNTVLVITDDKATKRDALEMGIRDIAVRVVNKFGESHTHVISLRVNAISKEVDNVLVRTGRRVARVAEALLAELASEGFNAALLAAFKAKVEAFDTVIDQQEDATIARDIATRQRIEKGNVLYNAIVKLANYGKTVYYSTNSAKYKHYLLTEEANAKGQQRTGKLAVAEKKHLDFTAVEAKDTFRLKLPAGQAEIYCATTTLGEPTGPATVLQAGADTQHTAAQLGFTKLTPFIIIRNTGAAEAVYEVYRTG